MSTENLSQRSLWGDLREIHRIRTPKATLDEQANILTAETKGVLVGVVESRSQGGELVHTLNVKVPGLNNYTLTLLQIHHPANLFPVIVRNPRAKATAKCAGEESLRDAIKEVLSSNETKQLLASLISQIDE